MKEVSISHKAFTRMPNLRFLKIYKSRYDGNDTLHRPEEMEFPRRLRNLQDVPDLFKLAPHSFVDMRRCSRMRKFPDISTNTTTLVIADTMLSKLPKSSSVCLWPGLLVLSIFSDGDDDGIGIQELPDWIKNLHRLRSLSIYGCSKLASLPELPRSLERLTANGCESPKVEQGEQLPSYHVKHAYPEEQFLQSSIVEL
ncbi:hypothetical protein Rs2_46396 [Raphanus sativus]|nr:hypothetical protein Rs2_46396 [Raphanus sativus]